MPNLEHLAKLKEGTVAWNNWRKAHPDTRPDLEEADLRAYVLFGANLTGADLWSANLERAEIIGLTLAGASLRSANLRGADLNGVNLTGCDLHRANLMASTLRRVDLSHAKITDANLAGAHFRESSLNETILTGSIIQGTIFGDIDLSTVRGLSGLNHRGPSTVGIDTIYRSKGRVPEAFLRSCGVPDAFITYMKSLVGTEAIEFYSCFISYSTKDQTFADRLHADLQNKGVRCWFAPHDVQGGRKLHEQIDEAIRLHDKLLLILSPHSMESEWVKTEIAKARKREVRDPEGVLKRRVLFPIRLAPFETLRDWECFDADTGKDSAREIREYFIPDFSNWKNHDSYQEAFKRLISDLKASDLKVK